MHEKQHDTEWSLNPISVRWNANHVRSYAVEESNNVGITVSLDGKFFVVAQSIFHRLVVYCVETGLRILRIGRRGCAPLEFCYPNHMCTTLNNTILVSDSHNKRIQEVTWTGKHVGFIGVGLFDENICGICTHDDIVIVGKYLGVADGRIVLFRYSSGECIFSFGLFGTRPGELSSITGITVSRDGKHIIAADYHRPHGSSKATTRLTMFTIEGLFVKTIGDGDFGFQINDVKCSGSNIFLADNANDRLCVFSVETNTVLQTIGTRGTFDGQFTWMYPPVLAVHKNKLFVVDDRRVQVLE